MKRISYHPLCAEFFGHGTKLVVPCLTKAAHERSFKETIDGYVELAPPAHGIAADLPFVVVKAHESLAERLLADWVEGARDGLHKVRATIAVEALEGAQAAVVNGVAVAEVLKVLIARKDTVFAANDARYKIALAVGISHALAVDDALCRCCKVGPNVVEAILNLANLVERYWCARIALHAADALARIEVAAESLREDVARNEYVAHLYDMEFLHNVYLWPQRYEFFCVRKSGEVRKSKQPKLRVL